MMIKFIAVPCQRNSFALGQSHETVFYLRILWIVISEIIKSHSTLP